MRIKTPQQISAQAMRILNRIAKEQARWEGRVYLGLTAKGKARALRARDVSRRYIDNIYSANGIKDRMACDTAVCNYIWATAARNYQ